MEKLGLHITCLLLVCMAILPSVAAYDIECSFGFTGMSCRENNTTQKILVGIGVALSIIVIGAVVSCCCCGCCTCCRSNPQHSTVVTAVSYPHQMPNYHLNQGYQPVPLQLSPAQLAMPTVPCPNQYVVPYPNYGQPPTYQEAASMGQPLNHPVEQPSAANSADCPPSRIL